MNDNNLRDAIYTKAAADATITGYVSTRIFYDRAPNDPTNMDFPYSVFSFIDDIPSWGMGSSGPTNTMEQVRMQVDHYSDSDTSIECANIRMAWHAEFDRSTITITGYTLWDCIRVSGRSPFAEDVYWRATDDYILTLQVTS